MSWQDDPIIGGGTAAAPPARSWQDDPVISTPTPTNLVDEVPLDTGSPVNLIEDVAPSFDQWPEPYQRPPRHPVYDDPRYYSPEPTVFPALSRDVYGPPAPPDFAGPNPIQAPMRNAWEAAALREIAETLPRDTVPGQYQYERNQIFEKYRRAANPNEAQQYLDRSYESLSLPQKALEAGVAGLKGVAAPGQGLIGLVSPALGNELRQNLEGKMPQANNDVADVARGVGSALPLLLSGGTAAPILSGGAVGGLSQAGDTRLEVDEMRRQGRDIPVEEEVKAGILNGTIGAAAAALFMKLMPSVGEWFKGLANPVARTAGAFATDAAINVPINAGQQVVTNAVARNTYDPQREYTQGMRQAVMQGIGAGAAGGFGAAVHANAARARDAATAAYNADPARGRPPTPDEVARVSAWLNQQNQQEAPDGTQGRRAEPAVAPRQDAVPAVAGGQDMAPAKGGRPGDAPGRPPGDVPGVAGAEAAVTGQPFAAPEVYRGRRGGDPAEIGKDGSFFSPDPAVAQSYAGQDGQVVKTSIRFDNPLVADNWVAAKRDLGLPASAGMPELTNAARAAGHDGIVFRRHNGKPEYVQLNPSPGAARARNAPNSEPTPSGAIENAGGEGYGRASGRQPWEMTSAEWSHEMEQLRANAQGTGGDTRYGGMGRSTSFKGLDARVKAQQARRAFLTDGLTSKKIDLGEEEAKSITGRYMEVPPTHRDVIEKALREGKPVPPEVLADYPDLKSQEPPDAPAQPARVATDPQDGSPAVQRQAEGALAEGNRLAAQEVAGGEETLAKQPSPKLVDGPAREQEQGAEQVADEAVLGTGQGRDTVQSEPFPVSNADVAPPKTGKLDQLEAWARQRLDALGSTGMRGGIPIDLVKDPQRLALHTIIAAAKVAKGVNQFAAWSAEMVKEFPEIAKEGRSYLARLWSDARRWNTMDENQRAEQVAARFTVGGDEGTKTTVRRSVGMIKDAADAMTAIEALRVKLRARAQGAEEGYRAGVADVNEIKSDLAAAVKRFLPPEKQGAFLGDIARVSTRPQAALAIGKARKLLAGYQAEQALARVEKLVGKRTLEVERPNRTDPADAAAQRARNAGAKPDRVPGDVNPSKLREIDIDQFPVGIVDEMQPIIDELAYLRDGLKKRRPDDVDALVKGTAEIEAKEKQLREMAATWLSKNEIGQVESRAAVQATIDRMVEALPKADEVAGGEVTPRRGIIDRITKSARDFYKNPKEFIDGIFGKDSEAAKKMITESREREERASALERDFGLLMTEKLDAAGIPANSAKLWNWLRDREEVMTLPDGRKLEMTRPEMLSLYGDMKDAETRQKLAAGHEYSFEHQKTNTPVRIGKREVEAIVKKLTDGERALVDAFQDFLRTADANDPQGRSLAEQARDAKILNTGSAPQLNEKGEYFPTRRNRALSEDAGVPNSWKGRAARLYENISSQKERVGGKTPFLIRDAFKTMFEHVHDVAQLVHMADHAHTLDMIIGNPKLRESLRQNVGSHALRHLDEFFNNFTRNNEYEPKNVFDRITAGLVRQHARAYLQFNPSPVLKNVLGGGAILASEISPKSLAHGVDAVAKDAAAVFKEMKERSGVMYNRYEGGGMYSIHSTDTGKTEPMSNLTFREAIKTPGVGKVWRAVDALPTMKWADATPMMIAFKGIEHEMKAAGTFSEAAFLRRFHDVVYKTQNGSTSTEIPYALSTARKSSVGRMLWMYSSQTFKLANQWANVGQMTGKQRAALLGATVVNAAVSAGITYGLSQGARAIGRAMGGTEKDEEKQQTDVNNFILNTVQNAVPAPLLNKLVELGRGAVMRGDIDTGGPVSSMAGELGRTAKEIVDAVGDYYGAADGSAREDKVMERIRGRMLRWGKSAATVAGLPVAPWLGYAKKADEAATFKAPDPRDVKMKKDAASARAWRDAQPAKVRELLSEKNRLDRYEAKDLKDSERVRLNQLKRVERLAELANKNFREGRKADADRLMKQAEEAAKGL